MKDEQDTQVDERYEAYLYRQFMTEELLKSEANWNNPNAVYYDADEVHAELDEILRAHGLLA